MLNRQFLVPDAEPEELYPVDDVADYRTVYGDDAVEARAFYNVGAGRFRHPCWQTVDFVHDKYDTLQNSERPDIVYDLTELQPLPIADGSAWAVYSSHTIEHVRDEAVQNLLGEAYRALRPGGALRLVTPDFDAAYRAYLSEDLRHFRTYNTAAVTAADQVRFRAKRSYYQGKFDLTDAFLIHFARQVTKNKTIAGEPLADHVRRIFAERPLAEAADYFTGLCDDDAHARNPGGHINWFNEEKLRAMLRKAGFAGEWIYRSGYGQSSVAVMRNLRYFDTSRPCFAIYVEAVKH